MKYDTILIEPQYLPPITVLMMIKDAKQLQLEMFENYKKSTFRNRCYLPGANGIVMLSIPLQKGKNQQTPINQVLIDYSTPWQKQHWKTILTIYKKAPYFEHYSYLFEDVYKLHIQTLADWNLILLNIVFKIFQFKCDIIHTSSFNLSVENKSIFDLRNKVTPLTIHQFPSIKYYQLFDSKIGFKYNMSALDFIFNEGSGI